MAQHRPGRQWLRDDQYLSTLRVAVAQLNIAGGRPISEPQKVTVTWFEQVWAPALHTLYVKVAWPWVPVESV
jgi:hypothetical protein